jgi:hypothetical protein
MQAVALGIALAGWRTPKVAILPVSQIGEPQTR